MGKKLKPGKEYKVDLRPIPGCPIVYLIYDENKTYGKALIIENNKECLLWDIEILKEHRREGIALALLEAVKHGHEVIITGWKNESGEKLCLKSGFKHETTEAGYPQLAWRKK